MERKVAKKEIALCRWLIKRLKAGYGADCITSDLDDFREMYVHPSTKLSKAIRGARCGSCQAKEMIDFLKEHIDLLTP
jgi:hypothetical protein